MTKIMLVGSRIYNAGGESFMWPPSIDQVLFAMEQAFRGEFGVVRTGEVPRGTFL